MNGPVFIDDSPIGIVLGAADRFFHHPAAFYDDLLLLSVDLEDCSLFTLVVTCDDLNFISRIYMCLLAGHELSLCRLVG